MGMVHFDVVQPASVDEAIASLAAHRGEAEVVAGGTDLLRELRMEIKRPRLLVSIDRIDALRGVEDDGYGGLRIGPATTMAELAADDRIRTRFRALAEAASWMGSPQIRNRATYGGNLCNARPCADTAPPTIVCDGELLLRSERGTRQVEADAFMTGPGQTVREPDEICEAIQFKALPAYSGSAFETVTNRKAVEITITSASSRVTLEAKEGPVKEIRVCLGSVAPRPVRAPSAEATLRAKLPTDENLDAAAAAAVADATPIDDLRGHASYRNWMIEVLVRRTLERAVAQARGGAA